MGLAVLTILALPGPAAARAKRSVVKVKTVEVTEPGNPSVAIVPFYDGVYASCAEAPVKKMGCDVVGGVDYRYGIGQLEITVEQWVAFLNTVDPSGRNRHRLSAQSQSSSQWPGYGQVNRSSKARKGKHYSVASGGGPTSPTASPASSRPPASSTASTTGGCAPSGARRRAASGRHLQGQALAQDRARHVQHAPQEDGPRSHKRGFVVPSQDEWIKAAYFDPDGGGTLSYWKYPTNPGVFGDDVATAPSPSTLDFSTGDVTNSATQPLAAYHASGVPAPTWCPAAAQTAPETCSTANPFGFDPDAYAEIYQGTVGSVGQALTTSPWGTLDQGGNAVEWTDTITPPPSGRSGGRVWRRLHGGIANAPAYQLWLSAIGLQPQNNAFYDHTYPWLGFRVGVIGGLRVDRG